MTDTQTIVDSVTVDEAINLVNGIAARFDWVTITFTRDEIMDAVARIEPFDEGYPDKPIFTDAVDRVQNSAFWTNNFADYLISRGWDYMIDASLDILKDQIID